MIDEEALELARKVTANPRVLALGFEADAIDLAHALIAAAEEMERMRAVVERASAIVSDFRDDIERASRYRATRDKGGQQVSPTHEFAAVPPSGLSAMHRVARELTMVLSDAQVTLAAPRPGCGKPSGGGV